MFITITDKADSRIKRHGLNVYPLEAYGFLIGTVSEYIIYAALPVGKTSHWYDRTDRFRDLNKDCSTAIEIGRSYGLTLLGIYHTGTGGHPQSPGSEVSPLADAPPGIGERVLLIKRLDGGESILRNQLYMYFEEKGWQEQESKVKRSSGLSRQPNPKRIHKDWVKARGIIDYSNNAQTEYERLFGS